MYTLKGLLGYCTSTTKYQQYVVGLKTVQWLIMGLWFEPQKENT